MKEMNAGDKRNHIIANRKKREKSPGDSKIAPNKKNSESKIRGRTNWPSKKKAQSVQEVPIFEELNISEILI